MNNDALDDRGTPIPSARCVEDRFAEAVARGSLSRDPFAQTLFLDVAERLRAEARAAEVVGIAARDYRRPMGGGGGCPAKGHDAGLGARERFRATHAAIGLYAWPYIEAVILGNLGLVEAGQRIAGVKSRNTASDKAKRALVQGLRSLVAHWRLAPVSQSAGIQSVRQDGIRIDERDRKEY